MNMKKNQKKIMSFFVYVFIGMFLVGCGSNPADVSKIDTACDHNSAGGQVHCKDKVIGTEDELLDQEKPAEKCAKCGNYPENCPPDHTCVYATGGGKCTVWACCSAVCPGNGDCETVCTTCGNKHYNNHVSEVDCDGCEGEGCGAIDYSNHGDTPPTLTKPCPKCGRYATEGVSKHERRRAS